MLRMAAFEGFRSAGAILWMIRGFDSDSDAGVDKIEGPNPLNPRSTQDICLEPGRSSGAV